MYISLLCNYNFEDQFYSVRKEVNTLKNAFVRTAFFSSFLFLQIFRTSGAEVLKTASYSFMGYIFFHTERLLRGQLKKIRFFWLYILMK